MRGKKSEKAVLEYVEKIMAAPVIAKSARKELKLFANSNGRLRDHGILNALNRDAVPSFGFRCNLMQASRQVPLRTQVFR